MRAVVDLLTTSPACEWICAVSLSGQKHVVPFARVNRGAKWAVRMEGADVASDARAFAALLAPAARLRLAGFSSTDIQTGEPPFVRLRGDALATWRMEWPALAPHRSSHLLELVLSCITKEHAHEVLIKAEAAL